AEDCPRTARPGIGRLTGHLGRLAGSTGFFCNGRKRMNRTNEPKSPDRNFLPFLSLVPPSSLHNRGCAGTIRPKPEHTKTSEIPKDSGVLRSPCWGWESP